MLELNSRAVIYARVSSQIQKDKQTIASQLSTLPAYVASQGWKLVKPVDTYVDDGRTAKSGHLEKREGWRRLVKDMAAGLFDVVVVVDQDRLTRSEDMIERAQILGAFQRADVKIAVASTGQILDLGSSEGDLLSMLQAWVAAEHNRKHRERVKRGKLEAISKGKKPAGPTPFGYRYERATGIWSIHEQNGPVVVEIFERVAAGESCQVIALDLHARGIERPRCGFWSRERVWQITRARTYLGEWVADKRKGLKVPVPRIIPEELYKGTQEALLRFGLRGLKRNKHISLCQGIALCGLCGASVVLSQANAHDGKRKLRYYKCARALRVPFGQTKCALPSRRVEGVDEAVWARVQEVLSNPERVNRALAARKADASIVGGNWKSDLEGFRRRLRQLERAEEALLERFSREMISEAAMDQQLKRMSAERLLLLRQVDTAELQVMHASQADRDVDLLRAAVSDLEFDFATATQERRRSLLIRLVPGRGKHFIMFGLLSLDLHLVLPVKASQAKPDGISVDVEVALARAS